MANIRITEEQRQRLLASRGEPDWKRKQIKKQVFGEVRLANGLHKKQYFRIAIEDPSNPNFLLVRDKRSDKPLTNSLPEPDVSYGSKPVVATSPVEDAAEVAAVGAVSAVAAVVAAVATEKAKKPAAAKIKAPAKVAAKPAAKAPAKASKPAASKVKAPAAKPAAKAAAKPVPGGADDWAKPKDVRVSHNGERIYLGKARNQAQMDKMIADHHNKGK
jgi:hypothetical protein